MSRAVGDLKESYQNYLIDVHSPAPELWENNPRLTPLKEDDPDVEVFNITYDLINQSGWMGLHFSDAFRYDMEKKLGVPIKKTGIRPELWLSDEEKSWYSLSHCEWGWDGPFWLINSGRKQDNELKFYHRWQEFVDLFNDYFKGKVKLIQIGHSSHIHPPLKGVLNAVGKTENLRQLIRLMFWAEGTVGPISLQMVMNACAWNGNFDEEKPGVCIFGGKEGIRWHLYPHIKYLDTIGCLNCCKFDGCWLGGDAKGKCKDLVKIEKGEVPRCFEMIKPYMIMDAVKSYYDGGVLKIPSDEEYKKYNEFQEKFNKNK